MALSIPNRFVTGQTIDANKFNSNFDAITTWAGTTEASITTVQGQITTLQTSATAQGYGAFFAWTTTNQDITGSAYTTVEFDDTNTACFDTDSCFAAHIYTPLTAGAYQFNINIVLGAAGFSGLETCAIYITKASTRLLLCTLTGDAATQKFYAGSVILKANGTTDTFKVEVYASGDCVLDYKHFSGVCVKPD